MLRLRRRLLDAVERSNAQVLRLDYLGLARAETRARLSDFLARDIPPAGGNEPSKQNPGTIADRFTDPDAVRAYLAARGQTAWADAG